MTTLISRDGVSNYNQAIITKKMLSLDIMGHGIIKSKVTVHFFIVQIFRLDL